MSITRKRGQTVHSEARQIIANVIQMCDEESRCKQLTFHLGQATERAARYAGVSTTLIKTIRRECKLKQLNGSNSPLRTPEKQRRKPSNTSVTVMTDELEMDSEDSEHGDDPLALTRSEDINIRKKIFLPTCKTEIKQECEDSSSYLVSEVKCEGTPVHASFPTLKSELKEESCIVKEELMSEIKSEVQY